MNSQPKEGATCCRSRFVIALSHPACLCALLGAVTVAVFWPALNCDFLTYDDPIYFSDNARVQDGLTPGGVSWAFRTGLMGSWHPATWLSYMLDVDLFGKGPFGPHLTNLALHVANAILVFLLLDTLTGSRSRSWMVAALFALHPLRVESVAWVSERKDVLSGFFGLLALLAYARYARGRARQEVKGEGPGVARQVSGGAFPRSGSYWLALAFFALGLMSKAMLVTLPFVMLLLDYWPLRRLTMQNFRSAFRPLVVEKSLFFIGSLLAGLTTFMQVKQLDALTPLAAASITDRLGNGLVAYTCYLGRTFWPANLALPYPRVDHWPLAVVLPAALFIIGASIAAAWSARKVPATFVGWFWFAGMLLPVSGLIQWQEHSIADRFTYLPAIGLFLLLAWMIAEAETNSPLVKRLVAGGAAFALVACAVCTRGQLAHWRNSETLFSHALAVTEKNYVALCNLGMCYTKQGRLDEAADHFAKALEANPDYAPALNNLGALLFHKGLVEDAALCIQRSLQLGPRDVSAHFNLGQVRVAQGRFEEAIVNFEMALRLEPDYFEARQNLAAVLIKLGRADEALQHLRFSARQKPHDAEVLSNLGSALAMEGELDQAIACFRQAIHASPDKAQTHFNLGNALAEKRQFPEAIAEFKEALRLDPGYLPAKQKLQALSVTVAE